jgi:hypothetical protein
MLLGVYWYYGFPEGLYHFDYFTFRPGLGGLADGPATLTTTVQASDPAALLAQVRAVAARYPESYLLGAQHGALLRLTLEEYAFTDYTFHVAGELEQVLWQQRATPTAEPLPTETPLLRLTEPHDPTPLYSYGDGLLQAVSSRPGRHYGTEVALLRLDCHLPLAHKAAFMQALDELRTAAGLDVLYYFDRALPEQVNLMVFFGNGRQGLGGQPLRYTDTEYLRQAVVACLAAHGAEAGHLGKYPADYPRRGPHVVRMVDAEFVL